MRKPSRAALRYLERQSGLGGGGRRRRKGAPFGRRPALSTLLKTIVDENYSVETPSGYRVMVLMIIKRKVYDN